MTRPLEATVSGAPVPVRRVVVVANPTAGHFRKAVLDRFLARLAARGVTADLQETTHAGHLTALAAAVEPDVEAFVVCGGDGSISEAVTGLLRTPGPFPRLGIVPFGTANVLAHELGLPFRPERIADVVAAGRTRPLHPGLAGERPFVLMISAGFDADVVHAINPAAKRRWGKLAYAATAVRLALARQGRDVTVDADGVRSVCRLAVVTTARCYGGPMTLTRGTDVTRPGLRLVTLKGDSPGALARAAIGLALGRLDRVAGVQDRAVEHVRLSGEAIRLQVDGDRLAATDATVATIPAPLAVLVP